MKRVLTKTQYLFGLECQKYLWTLVNQPEKIRKRTKAEEFTIEEGNKVGELAKKIYPNGISIPINKELATIETTKEFLKEKKPLFEAGFEFDNCYSKADILVPNGEEWDLIEVKASTKLKDKHLHDVSFQKYVYEGNGLKIKNCYLMHLDKDYVKRGKNDVKKLFVKENITAKVNNLVNSIKNRIDSIFEIISLKEPPKAGIISERIIKNSSHDCILEKCLELPMNNVFCLYGEKEQACELYKRGIETIKDIPEGLLQKKEQEIQRKCEREGRVHLDKEKINEFLRKLRYPLYFLDFETFSVAVPMFNGLKPYSHVPFQFSIHIINKEGEEPEYFEYLYNGKGDPRKEFLAELQKRLSTTGSIIAYNLKFESLILRELGECFPKQKRWINDILKRIIDLLELFREFSYYNPKQQGSTKLKAIYPAITGESYQKLEIKDGRTAPVEFLKVTYEKCDEKEREFVRENLLDYCRLDTYAEVMIVNKLKMQLK